MLDTYGTRGTPLSAPVPDRSRFSRSARPCAPAAERATRDLRPCGVSGSWGPASSDGWWSVCWSPC